MRARRAAARGPAARARSRRRALQAGCAASCSRWSPTRRGRRSTCWRALPGVAGRAVVRRPRARARRRAIGEADAAAIASGARAPAVCAVVSVRPIAASLEDVFIDLITARDRDADAAPSPAGTTPGETCMVDAPCSGWPSSRRCAAAAELRRRRLTLTLDEAIARGLANSQRLAEIEARSEAADGGRGRAARAADSPLVSRCRAATRGRITSTSSRSRSPDSRRSVIYPDIPDNYRSRARSAVADVHRRPDRRARARGRAPSASATGEDLAAARADLRLEITRAFWALVTARRNRSTCSPRSLDSIDAHVARSAQPARPGADPAQRCARRPRRSSRASACWRSRPRNTRGIAEADLRRLHRASTRRADRAAAPLRRRRRAGGAQTGGTR